MSIRTVAPRSIAMGALLSYLAGLLTLLPANPALGGLAGFRQNAVGGVAISAEGILGPPSDYARSKVLELMRKELRLATGELNTPVPLRMISLRALEAYLAEAMAKNMGTLPEEVRFLAGIQRIQFVFVYPEDGDVVLAGPGEGWTLDGEGNVVGVTTGRPVLHLDDLMAALRYVEAARTEGILCSIDPTEEGYRRLNQVLAAERGRPFNSARIEPKIKQAFGPQEIRIAGVPATSHFARVLVAADYRMKRLAMKLEKSPVPGLPSYVDMIKGSRVAANVNPRWWMACNYDPLAASEDGLAWELRGPGVKVMTEDDLVSDDGEVTRTGRTSAVAQRWADLMTKQYDALSSRDAVFGELRNLMDLSVVAALIEKERLLEKAGLSLPVLARQDSKLELETWNAPKRVAPEVSILRARKSWIVTASGGVQVESWHTASIQEVDQAVSKARQRAARKGEQRLWWQ